MTVNDKLDREKLIVWLAAMLEAEGTFTFQYNEQEKDGSLHSHIQPRMIFVNSDFALVNGVKEAAKTLGFDMYERAPFICGLGKKVKKEVQYSGFKSLPFLKLLLPEMIGAKRECAQCIIDFIEYRRALPNPHTKYGDYEFQLLRRVREINSGGWNNQPKFSEIDAVAVGTRRQATRSKLGLVVNRIS